MHRAPDPGDPTTLRGGRRQRALLVRIARSQISPIFTADKVTLHIARENDGELPLVYAGWDDTRGSFSRTAAGTLAGDMDEVCVDLGSRCTTEQRRSIIDGAGDAGHLSNSETYRRALVLLEVRRRLLLCDHGAIAIAATMISPTRTAAATRYIHKPSKRRLLAATTAAMAKRHQVTTSAIKAFKVKVSQCERQRPALNCPTRSARVS